MTPEQREQLLDALAQLAYQDADTLDPLTTFLPLEAHRRALGDHVVVVLGGRGAGKTALFRLMNDPKAASRLGALLEVDRIPDAAWIDAFSQESHHPETGILEQYAQGANDIALRAFWMAHLLRRVNEAVPGVVQISTDLQSILTAPAADLAAWLPTAISRLGAVNAALDATDRKLQAEGRGIVAAYDTLDHLGQFDPGIRRRYISTLLALWLSLTSRYRSLRGKIFLRDDLFDAGELGFADATKLRPRSARIDWDDASLYRVLARHLANDSPVMREWLQEMPELTWQDRGELGWIPGSMPYEAQVAFAGRLAGKIIGKGVLKSYTSRWVLGRLRDAGRRITPRSMLWFWGFAAVEARKHPPVRKKSLVSSADLVVALRQTSGERVNEIREEYDLVARIENLRGMTIPLLRDEVVKRLGTPRQGEPKGLPANGEIILEELLRLGILRKNDDGQIDVPDIYRYKFEITPDYATAWKEFLTGDDRAAREQFSRELPILAEILRQAVGEDRWSQIGEDELQRKDYASARKKCENALELAENADDKRGEAQLWMQLGVISSEQGDFPRARDESQRAVTISRRICDRAGESAALWVLGRAYYHEGKYDEARQKISEALSVAQREKERPFEVVSLQALGMIEYEQNRLEVAAEHLKRSLSLAHEMKESARWEVLALETISIVAAPIHKREAIFLMRMAAVVAERDKLDAATRLAAECQRIASELNLSPQQLEALYREADAIYARDRGWSVVRAIFPDRDPPASDERD